MYNTSNTSENNVIEKARLARIKREKLKAQEKYVLIIQKFARGYLSRFYFFHFDKTNFKSNNYTISYLIELI